MASKSKDRRFFREQDNKNIIPEHEELSKVELKRIFDYLNEVYGINENIFSETIFLKKGKDLWITTKPAKNIIKLSKELTINSIGIRAIRNAFDVPKITTNFATYLNKNIIKNFYELNDEELNNYTHGYDIDLRCNNEFRNYLVLKYKDQVFGVGLISENTIKNQVPKGRVLKNQLEKEIN